MRILAWGLTDVGQKRDHNEDAFLACDDLQLYAVADGMGGHQGGDRASRLAVEILEREIRRADFEGTQPVLPTTEAAPARELRAAARTAGRTIFNLAQKDPRLTGMGTTLTTLFFHNSRVHLAHVGDSRAYLYRDERIEQLSADHSWIEEQVRSGFMTSTEAQESALKHIITRSVGFESDVEVDLLSVPFLMGDCFLLCSDGLSNHLGDEELRQHLSDGYYCELPQRLVDSANEKGGDDNITCVVIYIGNDARVPASHVRVDQETVRFQMLEQEEEQVEEEEEDVVGFDPYATTVVPPPREAEEPDEPDSR